VARLTKLFDCLFRKTEALSVVGSRAAVAQNHQPEERADGAEDIMLIVIAGDLIYLHRPLLLPICHHQRTVHHPLFLRAKLLR
jgi:hypothetical protein